VVFLKIPEQHDISREEWLKQFNARFSSNCADFVRSFVDALSLSRSP